MTPPSVVVESQDSSPPPEDWNPPSRPVSQLTVLLHLLQLSLPNHHLLPSHHHLPRAAAAAVAAPVQVPMSLSVSETSTLKTWAKMQWSLLTKAWYGAIGKRVVQVQQPLLRPLQESQQLIQHLSNWMVEVSFHWSALILLEPRQPTLSSFEDSTALVRKLSLERYLLLRHIRHMISRNLQMLPELTSNSLFPMLLDWTTGCLPKKSKISTKTLLDWTTGCFSKKSRMTIHTACGHWGDIITVDVIT